jgi:hypothetical protein
MTTLLLVTVLVSVLAAQANQCVSMGGACAAEASDSRYAANSNAYDALLANLPQRSPQPTRNSPLLHAIGITSP